MKDIFYLPIWKEAQLRMFSSLSCTVAKKKKAKSFYTFGCIKNKNLQKLYWSSKSVVCLQLIYTIAHVVMTSRIIKGRWYNKQWKSDSQNLIDLTMKGIEIGRTIENTPITHMYLWHFLHNKFSFERKIFHKRITMFPVITELKGNCFSICLRFKTRNCNQH